MTVPMLGSVPGQDGHHASWMPSTESTAGSVHSETASQCQSMSVGMMNRRKQGV